MRQKTRQPQKINKQPYLSKTWSVHVRPRIAREFTIEGFVDDNLAGLHEIRARMHEKKKNR